jgi:tetratricopeptide (TPR) repeat protein
VTEIRLKGASWPSGINPNPPNPLREAREQLEQAEELRQQRKFDRAETICTRLVRIYPDYFGALHTLGLIYADKRDYTRALGLLFRAAMLDPGNSLTLTALSAVCLQLDASEMAARILEQARLINPQDVSILVTLGEIYREEREYELAQDAFRQALALEPSLEPAAIGLGQCCASLGQHAEAAEVLEGLIKRGSRSLDVLYSLIQIPVSVIHIDGLAQLEKVLRRDDEDKAEFESSAAFVRAAALDKAGHHAKAWEQLVEANRKQAANMQQELSRLRENERASLKWLQENQIKSGNRGDSKHPISLFILGPSRSGKTSMEKLVSTLDGVKRGHENPIVENAISRTFQRAGLLTNWMLAHLPPQFYPSCREIYLEDLARRAGSAKVFTNTHPVHINDAGRIATTFPNVRFIFVKRDLEDNMLRIYMRNYTRGNSYAYDLKSIREHLDWYGQMMDVLAEKLPDIVRVVQYEDMISEPAATLKVMAELCDLPMPEGPLPPLGDDRGCAAPYRQFMAAAIER